MKSLYKWLWQSQDKWKLDTYYSEKSFHFRHKDNPDYSWFFVSKYGVKYKIEISKRINNNYMRIITKEMNKWTDVRDLILKYS